MSKVQLYQHNNNNKLYLQKKEKALFKTMKTDVSPCSHEDSFIPQLVLYSGLTV